MIGDDQTFDERAGGMFDQPFAERAGGMFDPGAADPQDQGGGAPSWLADASAVPPGAAAALNGAQGGGVSADPRLDKLQGEFDQLRTDRRAALDPLYKQAHDQIEQPSPQIPQMEKSPKAPTQQIGQGAMEFLQVATVFGALAGLLARRGTTTSLNAFGAAIKGFTEGNLEVYKSKYEEWKAATTEVLNNNQQKLDQYNMIWKDKKMNLDQKMEEIKLVASQYGDEITYNLTAQANYTAAVQAIEKQREFQWKMQQSTDKTVRDQTALMSKLQDKQDKKDEIKTVGDGIISGLQDPKTTGLYSNQLPLRAYLTKQGFNQAQAELQWRAAEKQVTSQNGPQQGRFFGLAKGVDSNIDRVLELSKQMDLSGMGPWNTAKLEYLIKTRGNTPEGRLATRYITAVADLKEPLAQLSNGAYAPTESSWVQANKQVNSDYGVKQLADSLDEVKRSIKFRVNAIKSIGGLPPGSENRYASPATTEEPPNKPAAQQDPLGIR